MDESGMARFLPDCVSYAHATTCGRYKQIYLKFENWNGENSAQMSAFDPKRTSGGPKQKGPGG